MSEVPNIRIRLLGRVEVSVDDQPVALPPGKPRLLLVTLALAPNQPIAIELLANRLWGEDPPARIRGSLQTYVVRLRRLLGATTILTHASGYQLAIPNRQIDLWHFRQQVDRASRLSDPVEQRTAMVQALDMWRGEPLADSRSDTIDRDEIPRLLEERLTALETRLDLDLQLGHHTELISELRELTARNPVRESLWLKLLSALARAGRAAEAIEGYHSLRATLKNHLGLDPSPSLQQLYRTLLSGQQPTPHIQRPAPSAAGPPQQLPPHITHLTGRDEELAGLTAVRTGQATTIITMTGPAGVGKTALAVSWAHQHRRHFPDGQLYLNLHGYGPAEPTSTTAALDALLRTLGVPIEQLGDDIEERSAALRTALSGKRMLMLLDNARNASQIRPLLPGGTCLTLVTSRSQLRGLTAREGAERIILGKLARTDAVRLLARGVGASRAEAHQPDLHELAALCGDLPLALQVAAEQVRRYPSGELGQLIVELRSAHNRLDALAGDDPSTDLRALFSWSYRALDPDTAAVFRLLGLHPGNDIELPAAAALTDLPSPRIRYLLDRLVAVHLLEHPRPGRYEFHDLLRAYATEQAHQHDSASVRDAALHRILNWYLHSAHNAHRQLHPTARADLVEPPDSQLRPMTFTTHQQALRWCETEHSTLTATVRVALEHDHPDLSWRLALALLSYLRLYRGRRECITVGRLAVSGAQLAGDPRGEYHAANALGLDYQTAGRPQEAITALQHGLRLCEQVGDDPYMMSSLLNNLGLTYKSLHRYDEALDCHLQAADYATNTNDAMLGVMYSNLGDIHIRTGHYRTAIDYTERALALFHQSQERHFQAIAIGQLGEAHAALGDYTTASRYCDQALAQMRDLGAGAYLADVLITQGTIQRQTGRPDHAKRTWQRALAILNDTDNSEARRVTALLEELER